jgi:hypothetical protein
MCKVFKLGDEKFGGVDRKILFYKLFCRNFIKYFQNFINFKTINFLKWGL